eukprot:1159434-Pelagomonas_calceolata.AAC.6
MDQGLLNRKGKVLRKSAPFQWHPKKGGGKGMALIEGKHTFFTAAQLHVCYLQQRSSMCVICNSAALCVVAHSSEALCVVAHSTEALCVLLLIAAQLSICVAHRKAAHSSAALGRRGSFFIGMHVYCNKELLEQAKEVRGNVSQPIPDCFFPNGTGSSGQHQSPMLSLYVPSQADPPTLSQICSLSIEGFWGGRSGLSTLRWSAREGEFKIMADNPSEPH